MKGAEEQALIKISKVPFNQSVSVLFIIDVITVLIYILFSFREAKKNIGRFLSSLHSILIEHVKLKVQVIVRIMTTIFILCLYKFVFCLLIFFAQLT